MKKKFFASVFVLVMAGIVFAGQKTVQPKIVEHVLDNGLKILILEKPSVPVAALEIWYNVGSVDEVEKQKGIAHLFEHMMFRGSKNYGPQEHTKLIQRAGGKCNAYTSDEMTVYSDQVPSDKLPMVLKLEADRMASLVVDYNTLQTERQVVMEEYRMRIENDPVGAMMYDVRQYLFADNPYEFGPIGKINDIRNFSVEECRNFFKRYYVPSNAVLVVVGDVKVDEVIKMVDDEFGKIPAGQHNDREVLTISKEKIPAKFKGTTRLPVPVTVLSFYTCGHKQDDSAALELIFESLAQGKSSRLEKKLVRDKKIVEHFVGIEYLCADAGTIYIGGTHLPYMSGAVVRNIMAEIKNIQKHGLSDEEFAKAINARRSEIVFERYRSNGLASSIGFLETIKGDYKKFYEIEQEIKDVTKEDIIRVANEYFTKENMRLIRFEPQEQKFFYNLAGFIKSLFAFLY